MNHGLMRYQQSVREYMELGEVIMLSPTLDEYIAKLCKLRELHGGSIEVEKWLPAKGRHPAPDPQLAYKRRYNKKGSSEECGIPQFYHVDDNDVQRGDPVIRI